MTIKAFRLVKNLSGTLKENLTLRKYPEPKKVKNFHTDFHRIIIYYKEKHNITISYVHLVQLL